MKSVFLHCAACLALCLLLPAAACALELTCIVPESQYVNVRNRASSSAATWGQLHAGDTIEADPALIDNGFFRTTYNGHEAYVSVRYFEIPDEGRYIVKANGRVRIRKSPGGTASGFVQPGDRVYVTGWRFAGDGSKWARCTGGEYVSAAFLIPEAK